MTGRSCLLLNHSERLQNQAKYKEGCFVKFKINPQFTSFKLAKWFNASLISWIIQLSCSSVSMVALFLTINHELYHYQQHSPAISLLLAHISLPGYHINSGSSTLPPSLRREGTK